MGELVDARTAADRLGVDIRTLYAYVSRGSLRRVRGADGRSSRYDSDELELLAQRSRPRTLPRPAASIDLVIATRVSTVTDGMVRYRGTNVLDLVATFSGESTPPVRVGLATGELISVMGDLYGPDVNLAARLVAVAEPATAVVARRTRDGTDEFDFEALPARTLKGFPDPVTSFILVARHGAP